MSKKQSGSEPISGSTFTQVYSTSQFGINWIDPKTLKSSPFGSAQTTARQSEKSGNQTKK